MTVTVTGNTVTPVSPSDAARMAGEAAARGAIAAANAAENAAKPGTSSSEFKTTLIGIGLAAVYGGLQAFSIIPGPWQLPAVVLLAIAGTAGAYATGRSKVKAAALAATSGSGVGVATAALSGTAVVVDSNRYKNPG